MPPKSNEPADSSTTKKIDAISNTEFDAAYLYWQEYRWEFMRRDPEYQKAYNELDEYMKNTPDSNLGKNYKPFGYNVKFGFHWSAGSFPNPQKSFKEAFDPKHLLINFRKSYSCTLQNQILGITIDFAKVNSIHALKHQISKEIEEGFKQSNIKKKTKKNIDYSIILMAGDLKAEGLTYQQIAKQIFPQDFKNNLSSNPESAVRKVGQYYKTYKELINGGYKDLAFP